jgi:hypothetical protein
MVNLISRLRTTIFGDRDDRLSIPIMDGALKPNNLIEEAPVFASRAGLEDVALGPDGMLHAACGEGVYRVLPDGTFAERARYGRDITALAVLADGALAVALGDAVLIDTKAGRQVIDRSDGQKLTAVNALHAAPDGSLLITDGSATRPYPQWSHDLLEKGRSGRLLQHQVATGRTTTLAVGLSYAFGAFAGGQGRVLVSQSWRHQIDIISGKARQPAFSGLPGYPARFAPAVGGGFWLAVFACRTQLVEFVLCEDDYRRDMVRSVDPRYWVAPALSSGHDFLEPLQGGGVKQMGILKPWAPPRSYGLVIRFGADFIPQYSLHSRVGGRNHGIVAVAERGDDLYVLSKGAGRILKLALPQVREGLAL